MEQFYKCTICNHYSESPDINDHICKVSGSGAKLKEFFNQPLEGEVKKQGIKFDSGKPDLSHISRVLVEEVARVREFGAKKYARNNWRIGFKYTRSIAAALRHIFAFNEGENVDPESGLSHIAHAICCLEHLLNDIKNNPQNDDRKEGLEKPLEVDPKKDLTGIKL